METQVVVALIALAGAAVGYLVRPVGDVLFDVVRERRATAHRDRDLQFQTLVEIQTALVTWKTFSVRMGGNNEDHAKAKAVLPALGFRVKDDRLRELIEVLLAAPENRDSAEWNGAYGNAMRRLGEVLRDAWARSSLRLDWRVTSQGRVVTGIVVRTRSGRASPQ